MDILKQSVGYNDTEAGTMVLVPGTVIPEDMEDQKFLDLLEDAELLIRSPKGFKPNEAQSFFINKVKVDPYALEVDEPLEPVDETLEVGEPLEPVDETTEDDADPTLFSVSAAALAKLTIDEIETMAADMNEAQLSDLLALETSESEGGRSRTGVKHVIAKNLKRLAA